MSEDTEHYCIDSGHGDCSRCGAPGDVVLTACPERLRAALDEAESALADIADRVGAEVEDGSPVDDYAMAIDRALDRIGDEREAEAGALADVRDRLARALGYVEPVGGREPWGVDELIDAAGALASEVERLRHQASRLDPDALRLLGELAERLGYSMSLDATLGDHAEAIRDGLDEADRERAVLAQHRERLRAALERTGKHLGIDDPEHLEPHRLADQVEAAAWDRRNRDDALDAARLILRGGLATGDHELAMTVALRALEGR